MEQFAAEFPAWSPRHRLGQTPVPQYSAELDWATGLDWAQLAWAGLSLALLG